MTLPSSGQISLNQIHTEFGGPTPVSLFNYYRGGTYVPNTATNVNVPTGGAISLENFYGASAQTGIIMTAGANSGGAYGYAASGYVEAPMGSISPTTFNGHTLTEFWNGAIISAAKLTISFAGNLPQSAWTSVSFNDQHGNHYNFSSATASSYTPSSSLTTWTFPVSSSLAPLFASGVNYPLNFT